MTKKYKKLVITCHKYKTLITAKNNDFLSLLNIDFTNKITLV